MIRDVYWNGAAPYTQESGIESMYGIGVTTWEQAKARYSGAAYDAYYWHRSHEAVNYHIARQKQNWKQWLSKINNEDYYFCILTKNQYESCRGKIMMDKLGLSNYIVYESEYAVNSNHSNEGPRLKVVIFHFPEGFTCKEEV